MLGHPELIIMPGPKRATSSSTTTSTSTSPSAHHDSHDSSNNALCSAYSTAAKATEDWTTIEDRTERRRIQNRIAQRAYRQKLKERLLHLERKAASSTTGSDSSHHGSPSPEQHHQHMAQTSDAEFSSQQAQWSQSPPTQFYAYDDLNTDRFFGSLSTPVLDFDTTSSVFGQQAFGSEPYYVNSQNSNQTSFNSEWYDGIASMSAYPELENYDSAGSLSYEHLLRK